MIIIHALLSTHDFLAILLSVLFGLIYAWVVSARGVPHGWTWLSVVIGVEITSLLTFIFTLDFYSYLMFHCILVITGGFMIAGQVANQLHDYYIMMQLKNQVEIKTTASNKTSDYPLVLNTD